jgi:ribosomal protein L35
MKIKTHKATAKRFKQTRRGTILKRKNGQDHFNSRESGRTTRNKRRDVSFNGRQAATVKRLTPYA